MVSPYFLGDILKEETQQTMASQSEAMAWSAAWDDECAPEALPPVSAQALQRWHDYAQIGHAMRRNQAQPAAQPPARRAANSPRWWVAAAASGVAMVWGVWLVSAPVQPGGMVATQAPAPATTWVALEQAHPQHAEVLAEHRAVSPSALRMPVGFARNVAWSGQ